MTAEIEKNFFDTFGIEPFIYCSKPRLDCDARNKGLCRKDCEYYSGVLYPEITDRILLKLICILLSNNSPYMFKLGDWDVEKLKDTVLDMCIKLPDFLEWEDTSEYFKQQVQALFEEG